MLQVDAPADFPDDLIELLRKNKPEVLARLNPGAKTGFRLDEVMAWAGDDHRRWERLLESLKRGWDLSQGIDSPRDVLVRWAMCHHRVAEARDQLRKLPGLKRPLTRREHDTQGGRQADISFYTRLVAALQARAPVALGQDVEARNRLRLVVRRQEYTR